MLGQGHILGYKVAHKFRGTNNVCECCSPCPYRRAHQGRGDRRAGGKGLTVSDALRIMLTRVAHEKALPFEPLVPNAMTIAAMKEARRGKLETVRLDELQSVLDADN